MLLQHDHRTDTYNTSIYNVQSTHNIIFQAYTRIYTCIYVVHVYTQNSIDFSICYTETYMYV